MSSDEASYEAEGYASESAPDVPVYSKEDEENDTIVVNATVLNDHEDVGLDESDQGDDSNDSESGTDVDDEEEDQSASVACAVVVSEEIDTGKNSSSNSNDDPTKKLNNMRKDSDINLKEEEEVEPTISTPTKTRKRRRPEEKKDDGIPSVKDLGIPFRAIKRIMKLHPDIATVQNEAAIVTTYALELFVKKIVNESYSNAKKRGRNTVKYEDLAEARANHQCLNFLDTLLP